MHDGHVAGTAGWHEEIRQVALTVCNSPIAIRRCHGDAEKFYTVDDISMSNVEQVHHELDHTNLLNDPVRVCRAAARPFVHLVSFMPTEESSEDLQDPA